MHGALGVVCLGIVLAALTSAPEALAEKPSEAPVPSCLDQSITNQLGQKLRPRGVQKREFLKKGHLEIVAHGGLFASDLLSSSYTVGGALAGFVTEDLGFEVLFDVTPMALDLDAPVADFFGDKHFQPGLGYLGLANLLWSPIHAKMKIGGSIIHADMMLAAGAGRLFHDSVQGTTFDAGGVLELLTSKWITMRFDIRDVVAVEEAVAETRLTNNITITGGIALWIPAGL